LARSAYDPLVEVRALAIRARKGDGDADAARFCGFCILRGLRAHRVDCDRCIGAGRADRNNDTRRHAKDPPQMDGPAPGYVTVNVEAEIEPGVLIARHTHPGIESGYVLEGGLDLPVQGQPTRTLKVGDGFQVPPETPHAGGKNGDKKARIAITYVVEKGKPLASLA
jgi:quercetin dioxygenase-like cupin family protein